MEDYSDGYGFVLFGCDGSDLGGSLITSNAIKIVIVSVYTFAGFDSVSFSSFCTMGYWNCYLASGKLSVDGWRPIMHVNGVLQNYGLIVFAFNHDHDFTTSVSIG